jgi:hypothetical protein
MCGALMRLAYADPPYLGCCGLYGHRHDLGPWVTRKGDDYTPEYSGCWDDLETHRLLIDHLHYEFPDGWAFSASTPSLWDLMPFCPRGARLAPWNKPFAIFKPNVNPGYCWEAVIFYGGRKKRDRSEATVRDFLIANITLKKGLTGVKPPEFNQWILDLLGYREGDELVDLFPGKGGMDQLLAQGRLAV